MFTYLWYPKCINEARRNEHAAIIPAKSVFLIFTDIALKIGKLKCTVETDFLNSTVRLVTKSIQQIKY